MHGRVDIIIRVYDAKSETPHDIVIWTTSPIVKFKAEKNADELTEALLKKREAINEQG